MSLTVIKVQFIINHISTQLSVLVSQGHHVHQTQQGQVSRSAIYKAKLSHKVKVTLIRSDQQLLMSDVNTLQVCVSEDKWHTSRS